MQNAVFCAVKVSFTTQERDELAAILRSDYPSTADVCAIACRRSPFLSFREENIEYVREAMRFAFNAYANDTLPGLIRDELNQAKDAEDLRARIAALHTIPFVLDDEALNAAVASEEYAPGSYIRVLEPNAFAVILGSYRAYLEGVCLEEEFPYNSSADAPESLLKALAHAEASAEDDLLHDWLRGDRSHDGVEGAIASLCEATRADYDRTNDVMNIEWASEDNVRAFLDLHDEDSVPETGYLTQATARLILQRATYEAHRDREETIKRREEAERVRAYRKEQEEKRLEKLKEQEREASLKHKHSD